MDWKDLYFVRGGILGDEHDLVKPNFTLHKNVPIFPDKNYNYNFDYELGNHIKKFYYVWLNDMHSFDLCKRYYIVPPDQTVYHNNKKKFWYEIDIIDNNDVFLVDPKKCKAFNYFRVFTEKNFISQIEKYGQLDVTVRKVAKEIGNIKHIPSDFSTLISNIQIFLNFYMDESNILGHIFIEFAKKFILLHSFEDIQYTQDIKYWFDIAYPLAVYTRLCPNNWPFSKCMFVAQFIHGIELKFIATPDLKKEDMLSYRKFYDKYYLR